VNEDCSLKICDFGLSRVIGYERARSSSADPGSGSNSCSVSTENAGSAGQASGSAPITLGDGSASREDILPRPLKRQLTRHVVTRCKII
jgi:hypothetical protein